MNIPAIDVLRGVAALGVAWFHSRVDLWVGFREIRANPHLYSTFDRVTSWISLPVSQLGSMVMLFFVLSGFCIHLPLAGKGKMVQLAPYAVRRGLRIYPAYLATLVLCFVLTAVMAMRWGENWPDASRYLSSSVMLQNWLFGGGQVAINPSLWSIPVELELYIVYPLLLWVHLVFGGRASLLLTLACSLTGVGFHLLGFEIATTSFFKYAIIWNSGAWLAEHFVRKSLPKWTIGHMCVLILTLLATPIAGIAGIDSFYLHYGWGLISFLLLWWLITDGARFLPADAYWMKPLAVLGAISYSLYLIHFPLFRLGGGLWVEVFQSKPASFLVPTLATVLVIPLAWVFYLLFERPSHALARKLAGKFKTDVGQEVPIKPPVE